MSSNSLAYRPDIDGLRALAIIPVVLFHLDLVIFKGGFLGVDIFFVISGFLITKNILRKVNTNSFSFLNFYESRMRRLLPTIFICQLFVLLIGIFLFLPSDLYSLGTSSIYSNFYLSNVFFYNTVGYFGGPAELKPLLHTWSLSVEEQFYLILPATIFLFSYIKAYQKLLPILFFVIFLTSFYLNILYSEMNQNYSFYLIFARAWELVAGSIIACFIDKVQINKTFFHVMGFLGLFLIYFSIFEYSEESFFPGYFQLAPVLGSSLLILSGLNVDSLSYRILSSKILVYFGQISYALYIFHWPVVAMSKYFFPNAFAYYQIYIIVISIVLAHICTFYLENKIRKKIFFRSKLSIFSFCGGLFILTFIIGLYARQDNAAQILKNEEVSEVVRNIERDYDYTCMNSKNNKCFIGAEEKDPVIISVGDSHSGALNNSMDILFKENDIGGLTYNKAGYRPFIDFPRSDRLASDTLANQELIKILNQENIRYIILHSYWFDSINLNYIDSSTNKKINGKIAMRNGLQNLLDLFPNKKFIFIEDIPSSERFDLSRYARQIIFGNQYEMQIKLTEYNHMISEYGEVINSLIKNQNFEYLDISKIFCDNNYCRSDSFYRNQDHLNDLGAKKLLDELNLAIYIK